MLISLIGLPGVGKSTIGRRLAKRLRLPLHDCDALLEARFGVPIRTVFEVDGEARFRDAEAELLAELTTGTDAVIATGGGIVVRPSNRQLLRSRTYCVYLHTEPQALLQRLKNDGKRPLLQVADPEARLRELSVERDPLYRDAASLVVEARALPFERMLAAILAGVKAADRSGIGAMS